MVVYKHESRNGSTVKEEKEKEKKPRMRENSKNKSRRKQSQLSYKPAACVFLFSPSNASINNIFKYVAWISNLIFLNVQKCLYFVLHLVKYR